MELLACARSIMLIRSRHHNHGYNAHTRSQQPAAGAGANLWLPKEIWFYILCFLRNMDYCTLQ